MVEETQFPQDFNAFGKRKTSVINRDRHVQLGNAYSMRLPLILFTLKLSGQKRLVDA